MLGHVFFFLQKFVHRNLGHAFGQASPHMMQTGMLVGTPLYMSPEQIAGNPVDSRSDLFSLGVILYRMCAGKHPFHGESIVEILSSITRDSPPPPRSEISAEIPAVLSGAIMSLLSKAPSARPVSAREAAHVLATPVRFSA